MLKFRVRIELEKRFIKSIEACEFNCRDLEAWVESFALVVEPLLERSLRRVDIEHELSNHFKIELTISLPYSLYLLYYLFN